MVRQWFNSRLEGCSRKIALVALVALLFALVGVFLASGMWQLFERLDSVSDALSVGLRSERVFVREGLLSGFGEQKPGKVGFADVVPPGGDGCRPAREEGDDIVPAQTELDLKSEPREIPLVTESPCPKYTLWNVARVPLAVGLSILRGDDLSDWLSSSKAVALLGKSVAFKEYIGDARSGLEIILQDLRAPRFMRWFLGAFLRSAFAGDATFSYENFHGRESYVFSFEGSRTFLARKGLLLVARTSAVRQLAISPLSQPVLELQIAKRKFFLAQAGERFFLGRNISAILNAMNWGRIDEGRQVSGTVVLSIHPEAFFGKQLHPLIGRRDIPIHLGVKLLDDSTLPTVGVVDDIPMFRHLLPVLLDEVFRPMPKSVVGVAAASFPPPRSMGREAFGRLLEKNGTIGFVEDPDATSGGIGMVWDVFEKRSEIGVILTGLNGRGGNGLPIKVFDLEMDFVANCMQGNVALFASSERLLSLMSKACAGTIPSYSELKLFGGENPAEFNIFAMLNPLQSTRSSDFPPAGYVGRYRSGKGIDLSGVMAGAEF